MLEPSNEIQPPLLFTYYTLHLAYKQYGIQSSKKSTRPQYDYVPVAEIQQSAESRIVISEMMLKGDTPMKERKWYINTQFANFRSKGFSMTESQLPNVIAALSDLKNRRSMKQDDFGDLAYNED